MARVTGRIPELSALDEIERLEASFREQRGFWPNNVSYWNPSGDIKHKMEDVFTIDAFPSVVDYSFSYQLDVSSKLLTLIGLPDHDKGVLVTPSGSTSILMVARYLSGLGINHVTIAGPGYFTVPANLASEGIKVEVAYITRAKEGLHLPKALDLGNIRALWITNPVYCTGVEYDTTDIERFRAFLQAGGILICDECLAWTGKELCRKLGEFPGFIGIYSPHKSLCTNGIKYSFVVFPRETQKFFDDWSDAIYGCLPASSVAAINHSLSDGFSKYRDRFKGVVDEARAFVIRAARAAGLEVDASSSGYLMTCYAPSVAQTPEVDTRFMRSLIFDTAASLIPGVRNHFDPQIGLCFRVNLARDDASFRGALTRVFQYLQGLQ